MTGPSFARRHDGPELMDGPEPPPEEFARTLSELDFINRFLGGYGATRAALDALVPPGTKPLRVLDVGCADGASAEAILDWAEARGVRAEVHGVDLSAGSIAMARARRRPGLTFSRADLFDLPAEATYDVVHSSLFLHHCDGPLAARALRSMFGLSKIGLAVNDLHRHPFAYHAIKALTRVFSKNRLIRHDAPLSVLRGFSPEELTALCREGGLPRPELRWRWAFRWALVLRR